MKVLSVFLIICIQIVMFTNFVHAYDYLPKNQPVRQHSSVQEQSSLSLSVLDTKTAIIEEIIHNDDADSSIDLCLPLGIVPEYSLSYQSIAMESNHRFFSSITWNQKAHLRPPSL